MWCFSLLSHQRKACKDEYGSERLETVCRAPINAQSGRYAMRMLAWKCFEGRASLEQRNGKGTQDSMFQVQAFARFRALNIELEMGASMASKLIHSSLP